MQLRKFYARTMSAAMAQVKRELGPDALILETNLIPPDHPATCTVPGARYEILAARDTRQATRPAPQKERTPMSQTYAPPTAMPPRPALASHSVHASSPRRADLLEDLGLLRAQLTQLLEGDLGGQAPDPARLDLGDYQSLIDQGVSHHVLAPHFRRWLEWRTNPPAHRVHLARLQGGPAALMHGESFREWLWLTWSEQLGLAVEEEAPRRAPGDGPRVVALVGPTGGGKTTTLAKLASISCHKNRQNAVILTLDTFRFGATEQWRRMARLMGIEVQEITTSIDVSKAMEKWDRYEWVGIDTPGGITAENAPGILYGSILAQYPAMESMIVLPATQQESVSREQMKRYRPLGARKVLFSKLDETMHNGEILNLTMDGHWKIDSFATGSRIPEDWERANRETLWRRILAPRTALGGAAA